MLVEYKGVGISHEDNEVMTGVDFTVSEGEFVYLVGKVGSGKSSLLKTIYAELPINGGSATVFDFDLGTMRRKHLPDLRRRMGIVFQDFQLLRDRTVYDNMLFVLRATDWKDKADIERRINEVLEQVEISDKATSYPHELSGGEQQRVAIARAILNNPPLILADEPTGNLDAETGRKIVQILHNICLKGTAVVMTTHNLDLLTRFPGIVYRCEGGSIVDVTTEYHAPIDLELQ